jgi:thiosulfate/3-mercaptopyruvate sulfurtransferase
VHTLIRFAVVRFAVVRLAAIGMLVTGAAGAAAADLIVDVAGTEAALARGAIVWDVRGEEDYRKGHVPGAVNMDDVLMQLRESRSEDYLPVPQLAKLLGDAGIDPAQEIVVYGPKAAVSAYFTAITLQWLGGDRVRIFHGGIDDWKAAGKAHRDGADEARPGRPDRLTAAGDARRHPRGDGAEIGNPDVQIVDARTTREFSGDDIRALRGGHIPGAVNVPYESNWVDPDTQRKLARKQVSNKDGMNLKAADDLKALYAGLDPAKETIVYCQSGVRASNTAAVLQSLGFTNVKVYDASWLGYGNQLDAPAESVSYFNVGRVNNLLNQLQGRVDDLEAQISEMKGAKK